MKRLILHAGTGKTGTTTIQVALKNNEELLRSQGYQLIASNRSSANSAKTKFNWRRLDDQSWQDLAVEADGLQHRDVQVILSNESLWRQDRDTYERIRELFPDFDVFVVMYVREQADYIQATVLQRQKKDGSEFDFLQPGTLRRFLERTADYDVACSTMEEVFGPGSVHARLFARDALIDDDLLTDFFTTIGVTDLGALNRTADANPGLTAEYAWILQRLPPEVREGFRRMELLDLALRLSANGLGQRHFLTETQVEQIRGRYRESNARFASRYLRNAVAVPEGEVWGTIDREEVRKLAAHLIDVARDTPMLGLRRGWSGNRKRAGAYFREGWSIERQDRRAQARLVADTGRIRFRTTFRRRHQHDSLAVRLSTDRDRPSRAEVEVNGVSLGVLDVAHDLIKVPLETCDPYDQVDLRLTPQDADRPVITSMMVTDERGAPLSEPREDEEAG